MKPIKHLTNNTPHELAESIVFPVTLTAAQQKNASKQLAWARKKRSGKNDGGY